MQKATRELKAVEPDILSKMPNCLEFLLLALNEYDERQRAGVAFNPEVVSQMESMRDELESAYGVAI
jgi:hypothetical protein